MPDGPGRSCPLSYRYGAAALDSAPAFETETLWIAGGLYGNPCALERLLELYDAEPGTKALVFNGDFHWFDADAETFSAIDASVMRHRATRGNVETELALPESGAGCGCGYPAWVGDEEVARSNRILERLRRAAAHRPEALRSLAALPMHLTVTLGGERVAIVHGDADSLAGWDFSQERLATGDGCVAAAEALRRARARVIACSHTCLPVLQALDDDTAVVNNGAAGMPNFERTHFGLATRISVRPRGGAMYGARVGRLQVEARRVDYDHAAWQRRFLDWWPAGSDAHASYHARIAGGPRYSPGQALRVAPVAATPRAA